MSNNSKGQLADFEQILSRSGKPLEVETRDDVLFKNGAVYSGEWLGSMKCGFGIQKWPDGARYEGMWRENKACG